MAALLVTNAALSATRSHATPTTSVTGAVVNTQPVVAAAPAGAAAPTLASIALPTPVAWLPAAAPAATASPLPVPASPAAVTRPAVRRPAPVATVPRVVASIGSQVGAASWLNTIPTGTCANNAAPMGSILTVTSRGISVTCRVVSTGPFVAGRVVDLAKNTFAALGPVSAGLVQVTVSW